MTERSAEVVLFPKRHRRSTAFVRMLGSFVALDADSSGIQIDTALRMTVDNILSAQGIQYSRHEAESAAQHVKSIVPAIELRRMMIGDSVSTALVALMARRTLEALPRAFYHPEVPIEFIRAAIAHHLSQVGSSSPSPLALLAALDRASHVEIGPLITRFADGSTCLSYHRGLALHRPEDQGPATTTTDAAGVMIEQTYWRNGELHREDGPAKIAFSPLDGATTYEYWQHSCEHRTDGPAIIVYSANGAIQHEMWWRAGVGLHRDDGPAVTHGAPGDAWQRHEFWVDGVFQRATENGVEVAS